MLRHLPQNLQQVQRHVRIAGKTVTTRGPVAFRCDHLQHQVDTHITHVTGNVRVIAADVISLCMWHIKPGTGLQVELGDGYIRWQRTLPKVAHILQRRIVLAEVSFGERVQETSFEVTAGDRNLQRQGREKPEPDAAIVAGAAVQGIDQRIRFADAQRQSDHQVLAQHLQDAIDSLRQSLAVPS